MRSKSVAWGFAMGISILKSARCAAVAAAAVLACVGAQAADVVVGQSFTLTWADQTGAMLPGGYTDASFALAFDPTVFTLDGVTVGGLFGAGANLAGGLTAYADWPWEGVVGYVGTVIGGDGQSSDAAILHIDLTVLAQPAGGSTKLYLFDLTDPTQAALLPPSYYQFAPGQVTTLNVGVVPEPATVASMLAGLALLAGVGARRRRAASAAV